MFDHVLPPLQWTIEMASTLRDALFEPSRFCLLFFPDSTVTSSAGLKIVGTFSLVQAHTCSKTHMSLEKFFAQSYLRFGNRMQ